MPDDFTMLRFSDPPMSFEAAFGDVVASWGFLSGYPVIRTTENAVSFYDGMPERADMGRILELFRKRIAANIKMERMKKFPGRGGAKKCAEAFGVSPQQWSPWETGKRTPDETRMRLLADFFGCTVDHLCRDSGPEPHPIAVPPLPLPEKTGRALPPGAPLPPCHENSVLCALDKEFTGRMTNGERFRLSVTLVMSKVLE